MPPEDWQSKPQYWDPAYYEAPKAAAKPETRSGHNMGGMVEIEIPLDTPSLELADDRNPADVLIDECVSAQIDNPTAYVQTLKNALTDSATKQFDRVTLGAELEALRVEVPAMVRRKLGRTLDLSDAGRPHLQQAVMRATAEAMKERVTERVRACMDLIKLQQSQRTMRR